MKAIYAIPGLNDEKRAYLFEAFGVGKKVKHYNKNCVAEHLEKMREEAGIKYSMNSAVFIAVTKSRNSM